MRRVPTVTVVKRNCTSVSNTLLHKAESDLRAAWTLAQQNHERLESAIGFHAQQTVEKAIKAVLARGGTGYPWTGNLTVLLHKLAQRGVATPDAVADARWLSDWGMRSCYEEPDTSLDRAAALHAAVAALEWARATVFGEAGTAPSGAETDTAERRDTLPLPAGWDRLANGDPMPDVVACLRESRAGR